VPRILRMSEVLAVAALVISGASLLLLVRVAGRLRPAAPAPQSAARPPSAVAPAAEPSSPAGAAPDAAVLVRLDLLEAKVAVLEARAAQPLPAAPAPHADEPRTADGETDAARRPHPMFP
jgi:hypothetical protein